MPPRVARVALDLPLPGFFDYLPGPAQADDLGRRVRVMVGKRERVGLLLDWADSSEIDPSKLRPLLDVDRSLPPLPEEIRVLLQFCAAYYHAPIGPITLAALPTALRRWEFTRLRPDPLWQLTAAGAAALPQQLAPRAIAQRRLATQLHAGQARESALATQAPRARALLADWARRGWLEQPVPVPAPASLPPVLNTSQAQAIEAIVGALGTYTPFLLHGVTGSGKTEVYLGALDATLQRGLQTLVMVPEIGLSPQIAARISARFPGASLSLLHSGLAEGERLAHWQAALDGHADIVVGTRLAVFTPLPRLGLILVDEEHDAAYAQQEGLRYSARDVAVWRARTTGVPVVLGSATPSLESWANATTGRYRRLDLPQRARAVAPLDMQRIDLRQTPPIEGLAAPAWQALDDNLGRGGQSLIFLNRRGYAPVLLCHACGWGADCPRCASRLTLHLKAGRLRCHHCGLESRPPATCPDCGNPDLRPLGQGTQRLEAALAARFPGARLARADRDALSRKHSWETLATQIHDGAIDLIVGTQLIAKGHDFPRLDLVIVANADGALYSQDFRAEETLFAQLLQVSGRAGRADHPGRVLVQTHFPQHRLYAHLFDQDYPGLAATLLAERRALDLPPISRQARLSAEAPEADAALAWLHAARQLAPATPEVRIFDPVPALMPRRAGRWRAQLVVQSFSRPRLHAFLDEWDARLRTEQRRTVRWVLEVDPPFM
jgi:primosomal protein N' (replication factor Y)